MPSAFGCMFLLGALVRGDEPPALQWDLHEEHNSIDKVDWPKAMAKDNTYVINRKEIQLGIGLPESRLLMSLCDRIEVKRAGNRIISVIVFSVPMTKENAGFLVANYRRMFKIGDEYTDRKVDKWKKEDCSFTFGNPSTYPLISIDVAKSFDPIKPWHLIIRLNFVRPVPGDEEH